MGNFPRGAIVRIPIYTYVYINTQYADTHTHTHTHTHTQIDRLCKLQAYLPSLKIYSCPQFILYISLPGLFDGISSRPTFLCVGIN